MTLTLTCGQVVLRLATDDDVNGLVSCMPPDFDHDPTFPRDPANTLTQHRELWLRTWLAHLCTPSHRDRNIVFVVILDGEPVGMQTLEGADFDRLLTFDSTSFLVPEVRGRGVGVAMRTAVATLAFDALEARKLTSSARPDNVASRRVSERVGYTWIERTEPVVAGQVRPLDVFELTREDWYATEHPEVLVDGAVPWLAERERRRELAARVLGFPPVEVWRNAAGGLTFDAGNHRFLKVGPSLDADLGREAERLAWAGLWLDVPRVLDQGRDGDELWLLTQGIAGTAAYEHPADPGEIARELGRALRVIHDTVPVEHCPWRWDLQPRLDALTADARRELGPPPPLDDVVCHGDACAPNFLLDASGRWCGTIDLGNLGVADRHVDIVDMLFSIDRNFGPQHRDSFLGAYGDGVDETRLGFYSRLWCLSR